MNTDEKWALGIGGLIVAGGGGYLLYKQLTKGPPTIQGRSFSSWVTECTALMTQQGYTYSYPQDQASHLPCVTVINYMLHALGYPVPVNATFSSQTAAAVRDFQTRMGLPVSGVVAQNKTNTTWQALVTQYAALNTKRG